MYKIENNPIIREWHFKVWLKYRSGPEFEEYSGDSPKIVSNVVENVLLNKELMAAISHLINGGIYIYECALL